MTEKIEYRLLRKDRYVLTRFHQGNDGKAGVETIGEWANGETAYEVGYAMAKSDHDKMGWPIEDERIQYPQWPVGVRSSEA